jgi:hypothetical protein
MFRVLLLFIGLFLLPFAESSRLDAQTTQTYTWTPAALTFDYPADWVVRDDIYRYGAVSMASSQEALDASPIPDGQVSVQIVAPLSLHPDSVSRYGLTELTVFEALDLLLIPDAEVAQSRDMNGQPAAYRMTEANDTAFLLIALEQGDTIILLYGASPIGDLATFEDDIFAIAESIRPATLPDSVGEVIDYDESPNVNQDSVSEELNAVEWAFTSDFATYGLNGLAGAFGRLDVNMEYIIVATGGDSALVFALDGTLQYRLWHPVVRFFDVAIDPDGTLWVLDTVNTKIWHITLTGEILGWFGQYGAGVNQFTVMGPMDIVVDDTYVYVLSTNPIAQRAIEDIQIWDKDGQFVGVVDSHPRNGSLRDSSLLIAGIEENTLAFTFGGDVLASIYDKDGTLLDRIYSFMSVSYPGAIALDGDLVYFEHLGEIYRYNRVDYTINIFGTPAQNLTGDIEQGSFFYPRGLAVLPDGDLVIADANETHWQVLRVDVSEIPVPDDAE